MRMMNMLLLDCRWQAGAHRQVFTDRYILTGVYRGLSYTSLKETDCLTDTQTHRV